MKNSNYKFTRLLLPFLFFGLFASAQVGVKVTTSNTSALGDIQSTSKEFIAPKMTTAQRTAIINPIVGLMVFDTDINKHYFYEGNSWIESETKQNTKDDYVLINTLADLPTPVSGVITLASETLYEINGTLLISYKIDLNGSEIKGGDINNDKLVFTGTGALFTGTQGGVVKTITLLGNGTNNCFNLNDVTKTLDFTFRDSFIAEFSSIGSIAGFNMVLFTSIGFLSNSDGIIYKSDDYLFLNDIAW